MDYTLAPGAKIKPVDGLWPIERVCIPELAQVMYEAVTGKHSAMIDDAERAKWIRGMERVCDALESAGNVKLYPDTRRLDEAFTRATGV